MTLASSWFSYLSKPHPWFHVLIITCSIDSILDLPFVYGYWIMYLKKMSLLRMDPSESCMLHHHFYSGYGGFSLYAVPSFQQAFQYCAQTKWFQLLFFFQLEVTATAISITAITGVDNPRYLGRLIETRPWVTLQKRLLTSSWSLKTSFQISACATCPLEARHCHNVWKIEVFCKQMNVHSMHFLITSFVCFTSLISTQPKNSISIQSHFIYTALNKQHEEETRGTRINGEHILMKVTPDSVIVSNFSSINCKLYRMKLLNSLQP